MHKMKICLLGHSNSTEKDRKFKITKVKILLMLEPSWLLWQYTGAGKVLDLEIHTYSMIHWPPKQLGRGVQGIEFYPTTFQSNSTLGRRGMKVRQLRVLFAADRFHWVWSLSWIRSTALAWCKTKEKQAQSKRIHSKPKVCLIMIPTGPKISSESNCV